MKKFAVGQQFGHIFPFPFFPILNLVGVEIQIYINQGKVEFGGLRPALKLTLPVMGGGSI